MRFAICNETFLDWPHDRAFAFARQCGYTGIEIAPFTLASDAHAVTPQQRDEIRRLAEKHGLAVVGLHWLLAKTQGYYLTSPDPQTRRRTADYLAELARLCRDLGGSILVFGSPQQRNLLSGVTGPQAMDYAAEVFRAAMLAIADCGVTLAVEPLGPSEGDFLNTAAEAVELIGRVASPNCRLHLDCKAMSSEALPVTDVIRQFAPHMVHFHANDPNRQGPGFGQLDFVPIFEALLDVGYEGWVSVEVFDYTPGIERLARDSIEYMRQCLAKLQRGLG
jgi:sugar phosphate isomerase/epimerase